MGDSGSLLLGFSLAALTLGHEGVRGSRSDVLSVIAGAGVRAADSDLRHDAGHRRAHPVRALAGHRRPRSFVASPGRDRLVGADRGAGAVAAGGGRRRHRPDRCATPAAGWSLIGRRPCSSLADGRVRRLSRARAGLRRLPPGQRRSRFTPLVNDFMHKPARRRSAGRLVADRRARTTGPTGWRSATRGVPAQRRDFYQLAADRRQRSS